MQVWLPLLASVMVVYLGFKAYRRLQLSFAKHLSLTGHAKLSKRLARFMPYYGVSYSELFDYDGAPPGVAESRRQAFQRLEAMHAKSPKTADEYKNLLPGLADGQFTKRYRVPFPFSDAVTSRLQVPNLVTQSAGVKIQDIDGNWRYDLSGSYGVNVFGYDFYKHCMRCAEETVHDLGPVLGSYHPLIAENVRRLRAISGLDQVSFHMSGTEAVMQAVRLARYHTGRSHLVKFSGAYHGWWDGVQPGVGNPGKAGDTYTLSEMSEKTLTVLRTRNDIACVLINPIQMMHPNKNAPGDSMLLGSRTDSSVSKQDYSEWLAKLRKVCNEKGIVFILDEVFVGFRIAAGGAQEYFNVRADMVTYGKTLGGGLPIGVLCGSESLMKRYSDDHPADICFARGTFNSHPMVMAAMKELLDHIEKTEVRAAYNKLDQIWDNRFARLNQQYAEAQTPIRVTNFVSIAMVCYNQKSLYNWMYQYYLIEAGLNLSWVGTGRLIFSHNFTDIEFDKVAGIMVKAAIDMQQDGWFNESEQPLRIKAKQAGALANALVFARA